MSRATVDFLRCRSQHRWSQMQKVAWGMKLEGIGSVQIQQRCEDWRWHTGWHHATWTWWPSDGSPAENRTVEWSGEEDHPFERETAYPTLGMFTEYEVDRQSRDLARTTVPPEEPDEDAIASSPLMKAHLALIAYGRHQPYCPLVYQQIGTSNPDCICGFNKVLRETCPAPEEHHG